MTQRSKDPRLSLVPDSGTGIVGIIPNFQNIKNTHMDRVRPFIERRQSMIPSANASQTKFDWTKGGDLKQTLRMFDSIDPSTLGEDYTDLEILGGSTKS